MDVRNEVPFLSEISKTPSFLLYNRKSGLVTELDLQLDQPLTGDEGHPQFAQLNESEQLRALLVERTCALVEKLNDL